MKAVPTLDELRALVHAKIQKESLSSSYLTSGIPKGAITEISGAGKTEFVLKFLAEHPELKVAWVEKSFSAYPVGFLQRNVSLGRMFFVEAAQNTNWVALQVLRAQIFSVVVIYSDEIDIKALRRIQIASEKCQATTIWLSTKPSASWPVSLQLKVQRFEDGLHTDILKQRF
jgi:hypothetical protein